MVTTRDPILGLLYINNGYDTARWNYDGSAASIGSGTTVTYSFGSDRPSYAPFSDPDFSNITAFSPDYQAAANSVLRQIASLTDLRFVQAQPGQAGDIVFRHSAQQTTSGFAYSPAFPDGSTAPNYAGDVWIDNIDMFTGAELQPGGRGYFVLMHEIGHALGLQHSFDDTFGDSPPPYVMAASLDNQAHTVMTYTDAPRSELLTLAGDPAYPYTWSSTLSAETMMPLDIQALQHLYGANTGTASGNDSYRWDTNQEILRTIWDGGGTDTIDASNQVFRSVINLNAGQYSSIGLRQTDAEIRQGLDLGSYSGPLSTRIYNGQNNLAIARGVVIENARGGGGSDTISGNGAANVLTGGGSNDTLSGGAGNDVLEGNSGNDRLVGGSGNDAFYVAQRGDVVVESAGGGTDTVFTSLAGYVLGRNVENGHIKTAAGADLAGNELGNVIYAGAGNNVLAGGSGVDTLAYTYGLVAGSSTGVVVSLASTAAQVTRGSGTDQVTGFENLVGSGLADRLTGSSGRNGLNGGAGDDQLLGGAGDDVLVGGSGRDVMTGGSGLDVFDFNAARETGSTSGTADVIADFTRGSDRIDLSGIDARSATAANDAFSYIGTAAFSSTNATGQLRFATDGSGNGMIYASTDADAQAELAIRLTGVSSLSAADLVL
jgi:Ca2+-binding RTX toxin-like protein